MPYSAKQVRWAFGTHQPFAKRWAEEAETSGFKKKGDERRTMRREALQRRKKKNG